VDLRFALAVDGSLPAVLDLLGVRGAPDLRPRSEPVELADGTRALLCDPWDVPLLVERGVTEAGVVAKHVVAESRPDVYEVLDLRTGFERLVVATAADAHWTSSRRRPRVATTHPRLCCAYFSARGVQVETLVLRRAAEAAVLAGAADAAVVTLSGDDERAPGGLVAGETIMRSSSRVIVNRSARVIRAVELGVLVDRLRLVVRGDHREAVGPGRPAPDAPPPAGAADDDRVDRSEVV